MSEPTDRLVDHPFDHPFERGMRNRRAALGDAWVDKSVAKANAFNAGFQHFITDYAWHGVWGRPGLDWKTRRVLVMAVTCARETIGTASKAKLSSVLPGGNRASLR